MEAKNHTSVTEFILLGLTDDPNLQITLFLLFLIIYILTLVGNCGIFALIHLDSRLHTPMYLLLSNLSLSDFCYTTVITPRLLKDLLSNKKTISFNECVIQAFFSVLLTSMEVFLLSVMAYDRYVAICLPLFYNLVMNRSKCLTLLTMAYLSGIITAVSHAACTFSVSFCRSNVIDNFFCDIPPLMELSCTDTFFREIGSFMVDSVFGLGTLLIIVISYICILFTILRIPSALGRKKAFFTCSSHLTALSLFYGTTIFMYIRLPGSGYVTQYKVLPVLYTIVIPMLNPLIYSVRNQQVISALRKMIYNKDFK